MRNTLKTCLKQQNLRRWLNNETQQAGKNRRTYYRKQSNITLNSKTTELQTNQKRADTQEDLKIAVLEAYKQGSNQADMFFEEMTTYQADQELRAFLAQCKTNIFVEDLTVGEPGVATLSPQYYTAKDVTYDLKTYVTQGVEPTEAELATQQRWDAVKNLLGTSQQVGAITVDFTVYALTAEEIMAFCDEINDYIKIENDKETRKACMISGVAISYETNKEAFDELIAENEFDAKTDAINALYKEFSMKVPEGALPEEKTNEDEEEEQLNPQDYVYSFDASLTFYSVERMQDPTEQLNAQEQ